MVPVPYRDACLWNPTFPQGYTSVESNPSHCKAGSTHVSWEHEQPDDGGGIEPLPTSPEPLKQQEEFR